MRIGLTVKMNSPKLAAMNAELDALEQKVEQVLAMCAHLRTENRVLREQIGALKQRNESLEARAEEARTRLEALMDKLPAE